MRNDKVVSIFPTTILPSYDNTTTRVVTDTIKNDDSRIKSIKFDNVKDYNPDFILLNGTIHYAKDIQELLSRIHNQCGSSTRLIIPTTVHCGNH